MTAPAPAVTTLWRPVGPEELDLLRQAGWRAWPPRLPEQPGFYPVLDEDYAIRIAQDWNVPHSGVAYVTRFQVQSSYLRRYPVRDSMSELWIPATDLAELNAHLVGLIEVVHEFR
jgi:hypothetical protein